MRGSSCERNSNLNNEFMINRDNKRISDASKEFREINNEISKIIQNNKDVYYLNNKF